MRKTIQKHSEARRKFQFERLENRSLFAVDAAICFHNIELPEDADGSGEITPLDALVVINELNGTGNANGSVVSLGTASSNVSVTMSDIDGDASISALDALMVINRLNNVASTEGATEGSADFAIEERVARIERILASHRLAPRFSFDDAIEVIARLRASQSDDTTLTANESSEVVTLHHSSRSAVPTTETQLNVQIQRLSARLTSAEVSTSVVETISTEMREAFAAGIPLTLDIIKTRLNELGVNVESVFAHRSERPDSSTRQERFVQYLTQELTRIETPATTIATIIEEVKAAFESGTPLTLDQIRARLVELDVDVTQLNLEPRRHRRHR